MESVNQERSVAGTRRNEPTHSFRLARRLEYFEFLN
jgi:hypothetical protein